MPPINDEEVVDDRRATLEAAFEAEEAKEPVITTPVDKPSSEAPEHPVAEVEASAAPEIAPAPPPEGADKAPTAWRAPQRAKWEKLDPDIRQEIQRREKEILKTFGENSEARQLHNQFTQMVQPYQARINSLGVSPIHAVNELLKADYLLTTSPKTQRAHFMAKLINDYGVDIQELDAALAGVAPPDPVTGRVEQLLQERLAPIQQFLTTQQEAMRQAEQRSGAEVQQIVTTMAQDPKFPYFEDVRLDMADIVELAAKRGLMLSPSDAYNRAIAMNPEVSKLVAAQQSTEAKRATALKNNTSAQRAINASVSVSGSPSGGASGASGATDRRSAISAAFDALGG